MTFNPTNKHPDYFEFLPAWKLMRDCMAGEDTIKVQGTSYLPMKSGTEAIQDPLIRAKAYEAYKLRAEFPELVAPTVRGSVGVMLDEPAQVTLPLALEPLRDRATRDGLTLATLHRRVATELMITGRYGLLPSVTERGEPYLAGYTAEAIINWDFNDDGDVDWVVLDESRKVINRETGRWSLQERFRECYIENDTYHARVWTRGSQGWEADLRGPAIMPSGKGLNSLPFVFIGTNDLTPTPDDVPLYGLGKLSVRVYRLDADYTFALHMTSEPTPVATGYADPVAAVAEGKAPTTLGASRIWLLPEGASAEYLEFSGPGLASQEKAIQRSLERAVVFGAQLFTDTQRGVESGEALKLRLGHQTATLKTISLSAAAGMEKALKNLALWVGSSPEEVVVKPVVDFFDHTLSSEEINALVKGWQARAYSWDTLFYRLKKGGVTDPDRTAEEELEKISTEDIEPRETPSANPAE